MGDVILPLSGIYVIRNILTNKVYVGSAVNIKKRIAKHQYELKKNYHHSAKLQRAWNKYGSNYFAFELIELVPEKERLFEKEQHWLNHYNSYLDGYNMMPAAGTFFGYKQSEEHKRKIGIKNKGTIHTLETRRNMSLSHLGNKPTEQTRAKMAIAHTGNSYGTGYKHTEEALKKISATWKGRKQSPEHIAKRVESRLKTKLLKLNLNR